MKKKVIYWILIGFFCAVFLVSGGIVLNYFLDSNDHQGMMDDLRDLHASTAAPIVRPTLNPTVKPPATNTPTTSTDPNTPTIPTQPTTTQPIAPTTKPTEPATKPTEPIVPDLSAFQTENVTRVTFYGYYGNGTASDVPAENMAEILQWLDSFAIGEKADDILPPGTNTYLVEIVYADGTVVKNGLSTISIDGTVYYMTSAAQPDCFAEIIAKSVLPEEEKPTEPTQPTEPTIPTQPTEPEPTVPQPTVPIVPPNKPSILAELRAVYALNNDVVGWITIPNSNIDYPVLQRKNIADYYIDRNIYGQPDRWGSIYAEEHCDVFHPSDVVVLHGHHMADGSMFANIIYFKWAYYFNSHPYVYFDTLYEHRTYRVVLVFRTNGAPSDKYPFFPFHTYSDFRDEEEFDYFMSSIRNLAILESGVDVKYGDKLLCLSTCDFDPYPNGRMVLVAKLIE